MKKLLIILAVAMTLTSCSKEYVEPELQVKKSNDYPDRNLPDSLFKTPGVIITMP